MPCLTTKHAHALAHATTLDCAIAHWYRLDHRRQRANFACLEQPFAAGAHVLTVLTPFASSPQHQPIYHFCTAVSIISLIRLFFCAHSHQRIVLVKERTVTNLQIL